MRGILLHTQLGWCSKSHDNPSRTPSAWPFASDAQLLWPPPETSICLQASEWGDQGRAVWVSGTLLEPGRGVLRDAKAMQKGLGGAGAGQRSTKGQSQRASGLRVRMASPLPSLLPQHHCRPISLSTLRHSLLKPRERSLDARAPAWNIKNCYESK